VSSESERDTTAAAAVWTDAHDAWAYRAPEDVSAYRVPEGGAAPLGGMRFGVKDIIDVAGMPTGLGLSDRPARVAERDAFCVAVLRAAGAVPVGKTHTTALASVDPAVTRNPADARLTPGGSSAGSAAAVAAGDVPFALGTQTLGSIVRPAAYCGVVGFKPSYGRIPLAGINPYAPSFDTVGVIARDVATVTAVAETLLPLGTGRAASRSDDGSPGAGSPDDGSLDDRSFGAAALDGGVPLDTLASLGNAVPLRLAYAGDALGERFATATLRALTGWVETIPATVATVERVTLTALAPMLPVIDTILPFEAHASLRSHRAGGPLPPGIDALIERGSRIGFAAYRAALLERERLRALVLAEIAGFDALLLPLADEAPPRATTGDPSPQGPWTAWGCPAATLPVTRSAAGLPLSIGIVAAPGADERVLTALARLSAPGGGGS
jgi:aspartyl-tRNA(Asn)/glutamyl-tRNA(Gln) amidotransferase subunit A